MAWACEIGDTVKHGCEQYGIALIARHEGTLPAAVAAELDAHLAACAACRVLQAELVGLFDDLESLGEAQADRLPAIDLSLEILHGVADLDAGRRVLAPLPADRDDLGALLAGELDDFGIARLERDRAKDPVLAEEINTLTALAADLEALGTAHAAALPRVDLAASILAKAQARALEENMAPQVLDTLPEGIRLTAERYIEASATPAEIAELRAFAENRPALAALLDDTARLHADLEAIGVEVAQQVPTVDVLPGVMAAVRKNQQRPGNMTPLRRAGGTNSPARKAGQSTGRWLSAMAAAAAMLLVGVYVGQRMPGFRGESVATRTPHPHSTPPMQGTAPVTTPDDVKKTLDGEGEQNAAPTQADAPAELDVPQQMLSGNAGRTLKDALDLRRAAFEEDQEALAKLVRWSSLSEEEARKIAADKKADPAAILGAAEFLPPAEAAALLKKAIADNPDDPYLRKALAKAYAENGQTGLAKEQLEAWSKLDPENSLPKYLAARMAFLEGNSENALALLGEAAQYDQGNFYSAQSAQHRTQALAANGYNPQVASYLAGSTAGTSDYRHAHQLAGDLLDQGNQLRDAGMYDEAEKVYLGVYNMGAQLSNSARMANDFSTAYDIQDESLRALVILSQMFAGVDPNLLNGLLSELNNGMQALTQLLLVYNNIMTSDNIDQIMALIAATLNGGQLDFLQR